MDTIKHQQKKKIDKIRTLYGGTQGGIFRQTTREKMVTKEGISKKGRKKNQFWYRQRESVKTTLLDLQLFIEEAEKDTVNRVITRESLRPVVEALLSRLLVIDKPKPTEIEETYWVVPDVNRAKIAQLLIEEGFGYLRGIFLHGSEHGISSSIQRTIADAIEDSKHLVFQVEDLRKAAIERNERIAALAAEELRARQK